MSISRSRSGTPRTNAELVLFCAAIQASAAGFPAHRRGRARTRRRTQPPAGRWHWFSGALAFPQVIAIFDRFCRFRRAVGGICLHLVWPVTVQVSRGSDSASIADLEPGQGDDAARADHGRRRLADLNSPGSWPVVDGVAADASPHQDGGAVVGLVRVESGAAVR